MLEDPIDAKQAKCSIKRLISYVRGAKFHAKSPIIIKKSRFLMLDELISYKKRDNHNFM